MYLTVRLSQVRFCFTMKQQNKRDHTKGATELKVVYNIKYFFTYNSALKVSVKCNLILRKLDLDQSDLQAQNHPKNVFTHELTHNQSTSQRLSY